MDAIGATITFLLLFMSLSCAGTRAETQQPKNIASGSSLFPTHPPTSWLSPSGLFAFGFYRQDNGFVVGIWLVGVENNNTVVWTANRDEPPVTSNAKLQLTLDGKLVVIEQGQEKLIANASATASFASMLDSGNLVLYNNNSSIIWQSFDHPTDTMLGGQSLPCGSQLLSNSSAINPSTRRFLLKMQDDGNLVLYPANTTATGLDAYWASYIFGFKYHLYLNKTGSLQIRNSHSSIVTSLADNINNGNSTIYHATLDLDGFFWLYEHVNKSSGKKVESWPSGNACVVKGLCGFNSFCTFDDNKPKCNCLQGFDFIDPNEETFGCKIIFSKADCGGEKDSAAFYNMVSMENILWEDSPYYQAEMSEEEECSYACLADCNCWAALYEDKSCKKHGLPLRYVRRFINEDETQGTTIFLKVGNNSRFRNGKGSEEQPPPIKSTSSKAIVHIIVVTSVFSVLLCSTIAISCHYMYKIRVLRYKWLMETGNMGLINEEVALRRFSYGELKRATNDFRQELGKGSFGAVYGS